jgi:hypothetical protein
MRGRGGAQGSRHVGREPGRVGRHLDDPGADAGAGDAVPDVADEQLGQDVARVGRGGRAVVEDLRELVEVVDPRGDDDVEVHLGVDPGEEGDVAAVADGGGVDHGADARGGNPLQLPDDLVLQLLAVGHDAHGGLVARDLGIHVHHVLVHEREAERTDGHRAADRVDGGSRLLDYRRHPGRPPTQNTSAR